MVRVTRQLQRELGEVHYLTFVLLREQVYDHHLSLSKQLSILSNHRHQVKPLLELD